jgi:hypothetical protein
MSKGRPQRHNADWFSHDCDMRNDKKILAIRRKYGLTGYAVYAMILETLTDCNHFRYKWDELNKELMAADFIVERALFDEMMVYMIETLQLFVVEDGYLISDKLIERMQFLADKRSRNRANYSISATENTSQGISDTENTNNDEFQPPKVAEMHHSKVKNSKVYNTSSKDDDVRGKKKPIYEYPKSDTDTELIEFFVKNGSTAEAAAAFYNHFNAQGWVRTNGQVILDWMSAAKLSINNKTFGASAYNAKNGTPEFPWPKHIPIHDAYTVTKNNTQRIDCDFPHDLARAWFRANPDWRQKYGGER